MPELSDGKRFFCFAIAASLRHIKVKVAQKRDDREGKTGQSIRYNP